VSEGWPDGLPTWPLGTRVVVRRRLADTERAGGDPHTLTDVLGTVLALDDGGVTLETRSGVVRVPAGQVVLAKPVPPQPPRRRPRPGGGSAR
jgi:hypothetical protein